MFTFECIGENGDIEIITINPYTDSEEFGGWSILDTQGIKTRVILDSPIINQPIEPSFFEFIPPDWAFPAGD